MSGPRVTSGAGSKQDYGTPRTFLDAVERRFGPIQFDLAAHAGNAKHWRYFASSWSDPGAEGVNAFAHDWAELSVRVGSTGRPGLLWLNPEFADIGPWAAKCALEARRGANVVLLTPAVFANWYRDHIAGVADVYDLSGRLSFDGKNVFPKDCRLSHFWPGATGKLCIWEWATDRIHVEWKRGQ